MLRVYISPWKDGGQEELCRLRARSSYWLATLHQIGLICALTLSVIDSGYRLESDPAKGPPARCWLRNHPSALEQAAAAFVSAKVAEGVLAGTMVTCLRSELWCILPLGVAINAAGKLPGPAHLGRPPREPPPSETQVPDGDA